jgi:hypothetical protein
MTSSWGIMVPLLTVQGTNSQQIENVTEAAQVCGTSLDFTALS